jgi:hypothetical protein
MFLVDLEGHLIRWNGDPVNEHRLAERLRVARTLSPQPLIMFDPAEGDSCDRAGRVRDIIHREFDCSANQCWQGSPAEYERSPIREGERFFPW